MGHSQEVCNRVAETVASVAEQEIALSRHLDMDAFCHGLARGAGASLGRVIISAWLPAITHYAVVATVAQMLADHAFRYIKEAQAQSDGGLADTPPAGRA